MSTHLPFLADIFRDLARGRHIAADDGPPYQALREHETGYQELFGDLGFTLAFHEKGFYFFNSDKPQDSVPRLVTFVFVLVDWLADRGSNLVEDFFTRVFTTADLPHLQHERYARYMREHEVRTPEDLDRVVKLLLSFGFAARVGPDAFQFRRPAYRVLDLCVAVAKKAEAQEGEAR